MPISNPSVALDSRRWSVFFVLLLSMLLCLWLGQHSINRYWQQTYHRPSPLLALEGFAWWRIGGKWQTQGEAAYQHLRDQIAAIDRRIATQQLPLPHEQGLDDGDKQELLALDEAHALARDEHLDNPQAVEKDSPPAVKAHLDNQTPVQAVEKDSPQAVKTHLDNQAPVQAVEKDSPQAVEKANQETKETAQAVQKDNPSAVKTHLDNQAPVQAVGKANQENKETAQAVETHLDNQAPVQAVEKDSPQAVEAHLDNQTPAQAVGKDNPQAVSKDNAQTVGKDSLQAVGKANQETKTSAQAVENSPSARQPLKIGARDLSKDNSQAVGKDNPQAVSKDNAQTVGKDNPQAVGKDNPQAVSKDNPPAVKAHLDNQTPAQAVGKANQETKASAPAVEKANQETKASAPAVEKANQENKETASAVGKDSPQAVSKDNPQAVEKESPPALEKLNQENPATTPAPNQRQQEGLEPVGNEQKLAPKSQNTEFLPLHSGDKVLLIGDSLMQGVAPYVQQSLQQRYGVQSLDLSKQSTGLTYADFFDWPSVVEKTLADDASIKAVVVFLGPNDPWDMPDPSKKEKTPYLKFKSQEWEAVYRGRINRIVQAAAAHDAGVIWLGIPFMKPEPLNTHMQYLDGLMRSELRDKAVFVPTKYILTGGESQYVESIVQDGKTLRLRTKDGIHFTPTGQKQIAVAIMRRLQWLTAQ